LGVSSEMVTPPNSPQIPKIALTITLLELIQRMAYYSALSQALLIKTANINVKTMFIKTVIGDVVAHLKPQEFTVSSDL